MGMGGRVKLIFCGTLFLLKQLEFMTVKRANFTSWPEISPQKILKQ